MADTDTQQVTKKRDIALNRMKSKYPDRNFEDEEALFGQINDDYDDYDRQIADRDSQIEEYKGREKTFSDMFSADPRSAVFLSEWKNGGDPELALIRRFGTDIVDIINDPERQEEVAKANKEYADRVTEEKGYEDEYAANIAKSIEDMDALVKGGRSDEEVDAAFALLLDIVRKGLRGIFTPESFEMAFKALSHDADVETASQDGEVRGRNAKIDEKLRKSRKGDGTGPIGGKNGESAPIPKARNLGALDRYDDSTSTIWERGGEKRTKY